LHVTRNSITNILKKHTSSLLQLIEVAKDTRLSHLASYPANELEEVQFSALKLNKIWRAIRDGSICGEQSSVNLSFTLMRDHTLTFASQQ